MTNFLQAKILIVDDDPDILEFISYNLSKLGYIVFTEENGIKGLQKALQVVPDLIILDVMMPEMDGIETCTEMRKQKILNNSLICFLTARGEDYSQIVGLDAGGDDYIVKPIKPKVLASRVKALLRRSSNFSSSNSRIEFGSLVIDKEMHLVLLEGKEYSLPRKEFDLLNYLSSKPGRVFTREEILDNIWGNEVIVGDRTIDVHIRKLREKFGSSYIKTVKGVGYKFEF